MATVLSWGRRTLLKGGGQGPETPPRNVHEASIWCSLASAERPMLPGASCLEQLHIIPLECLGMLSILDFVPGIGDQKPLTK